MSDEFGCACYFNTIQSNSDPKKGSGATGRNGGHLTPYSFRGFRKRALKYGQEGARKSCLLEEYTAKSIVDIIQEKGLADAVDLVEGGHITAFFTEHEEAAAKADWEAAGRPTGVRWISKEEMKSVYGVPYSGVQINAHNLWPLKLVTALYNLTQKQYSSNFKLSLYTRTPVTAVIPYTAESDMASRHPRKYTLKTPRGDIHCSRVVHATNAYASHLLPNLSSPYKIIPIREQIIALRLRAYGGEQDPYMRMSMNSWDADDGNQYWFPRPSARSHQDVGNDIPESGSSRPLIILGGGRDVLPGFGMGIANDSSVDDRIGAKLRRFLGDLFEDVRGVDVEWEWTGIVGFTHSEGPIVGRVPLKAHFPTQEPGVTDASQATINNEAVVDANKNGQYIAAGYTGHGMPRAFGCAEALARMITADIYNRKWAVPDWFPSNYLL